VRVRWLLSLALLASVAHADPAFYLRGANTNQAIGGLNGNFLDSETQRNDRLTQTITPKNCPVGFALTGAFFHNGYTFGGLCSQAGSSSGVTQIIAGTGITISPAGGTGVVTINSTGGTDFGPSTAALSIRLNQVAVSTTALSASTVSLSGRLDQVATATTTLSASTVTLYGLIVNVGASTQTLANAVALSTTNLVANSTAYLHVDGSNSMVGQLTEQSSATFQGTVKLATIAGQCLQTDGSGNVTGTGSACAASTLGTIGFLSDNFLAQANGTNKSFTLTTTPSLNSEHVVLDGTVLSGTSDYTLSGVTLTLTTAPVTACTSAKPNNCTSEFFVKYASGAVLASNAAVLNATQTFTGTNSFLGAASLTGPVYFTADSAANMLNSYGPGAVWATSIDGASESSGCVVVVTSPNNVASTISTYTFTSTTTATFNFFSNMSVPGVLLQTCASGASCLVALSGGPFRVQTTNTSVNYLETSATRCQVQNETGFDALTLGYPMTKNVGASFIWMRLR
jgi:hypothetical protein